MTQAYLVVDDGGARWAAKALAKMETSHRGAKEQLGDALEDLLNEMKAVR